MTHVIEGWNCERLRVELAAGEGVNADVGKLVYLRAAVEWNVVMPGRVFAWKIAAGIRRKIPWWPDRLISLSVSTEIQD